LPCLLLLQNKINPIIARIAIITANAIPTLAPVERPFFLFFGGEAVAVGGREADDEDDAILVELLDRELELELDLELELLLLLLLKIKLVDVTKLSVLVVLALVSSGTVVGPVRITSVMPEMTVVMPESENREFTGMVIGPLIASSKVLPMTVRAPGREVIAFGWATVVGLGIITTGEPFITVVMPPGIPEARERGMIVAEGKTKYGTLSIIAVRAPGILGGAVGSWKIVAEGMIRKGVPLIIVVIPPLNPGGSFTNGT
jgi:hypothetical protein